MPSLAEFSAKPRASLPSRCREGQGEGIRSVELDGFRQVTTNSRFIDATDPLTPPAGLEGAVVAIGNFDGLHRGHRGVIARAKALAAKLGKPCAVLTFEPHPADFFAKKSVIFRLTSHEAKAAFLDRLGLDGIIVLTFDATLSGLTAQQFVDDVLVRRLGVSGVVAGYDFHFGAKRLGTPEFLKAEGARQGFAVDIVERISQDEEGSLDAVSSTATRAALESGDVALAARLLGHPWFVEGEVIHGAKRGRTIGFPTANIALDPSCKLRHGIYAVTLTVDGKTFGGAANFGKRPTFDDGPPLLEVYVLDFDGDLYGTIVEVAFIGFIRPEAKFDSVEALVVRMNEDVAEARRMLADQASR
ncbi:MAG: bifunctional riboflavin kinase/FAD synthetase [Methylobacteriaceae bacterium]|nr:bifunctional riboflavin kinase/FAD synthetase [Rhodoblastus sp.]MCC0005954.1 bifunctional riboflavin kinase/FAD synthetase [Methylobacteriaceae bacterium]